MGILKKAVLVLWLVLLLSPAATVAHALFATITLQDSPPVHAYRNLAETGDMLVVFHWKWSDNTSSSPGSQTVLMTLSYNGTIVAQTTPYVYSPFSNNGYGDGISSFYLSANSTPVYGGNYTIRIAGLPAYFGTFAPPAIFDYTLQASDYDTASTQALNRADLKTYILSEADEFLTIYPTVELKSSTDIGTVLSSYGEAYFGSVIPGLQSLCPSLYFVQQYIPATMTVTPYDNSLQTTLSNQIVGTDLKRGADRAGAVIGVSGYFIWGLIAFATCIYVLIRAAKAGWELQISLFVCGCILTGFALAIGSMIFTIVMIGTFLALIGIAFAIFGKRAT